MENQNTLFNSTRFRQKFHYSGKDLGARLTPLGTEFRLWAPTAQSVQLRLYPSGHQGEAARTLDMERRERGSHRQADLCRFQGGGIVGPVT